MSPLDSLDAFVTLLQQSQLIPDDRLEAYVVELDALGFLPDTPTGLAEVLVRDGLLTHFQAEELLKGKWKRFTIGKYKVLERLGYGGMGEVYLCEHERMSRRVAVKVMPAAVAKTPGAVERFEREGKLASSLNHPNIVRTYDFDQDGDTLFMVMEYVEGLTLHDLTQAKGPLPIPDACHYIGQAALALQHAHENGMIHRDVKPGNVIVDLQGTAKLMDLGLARLAHDEMDHLTRRFNKSGILGTADYLSPEQGRDSHTVDIRADIYSLGATLYYCLTGRPPFAGGSPSDKLIAHQSRQPDSIYKARPEVPLALVLALNRMMAKQAEKRYQTPSEVVAALAAWAKPPDKPIAPEDLPQFSLAARNVGLPAPPTEPPAARPGSVPPPGPQKAPAPTAAPAQRKPIYISRADSSARPPSSWLPGRHHRAALWTVLAACVAIGVAGGVWLAAGGNVKPPGPTTPFGK